MAHTDDFLNAFTPDPDTFDFEKFKADALAAFQKDQTTADAKIRTQTQQISEFERTVLKLGAENYDLVMKTGTPIGDAPNTTGDAPGDKDGEKITMDDVLAKIREG